MDHVKVAYVPHDRNVPSVYFDRASGVWVRTVSATTAATVTVHSATAQSPESVTTPSSAAIARDSTRKSYR